MSFFRVSSRTIRKMMAADNPAPDDTTANKVVGDGVMNITLITLSTSLDER